VLNFDDADEETLEVERKRNEAYIEDREEVKNGPEPN